MSARRRPVAVLLAAAVAGAPSAGSAAPRVAAVAADTTPARVGISVDTTGLGPDEADPVARLVSERADRIWLTAEVLPAKTDEEPVVAVRISRLPDDPDSYRIAVTVHRTKGGEIVGAPAEATCRTCTEGEMLDEVETLLASMLSRAVAVAGRGGEAEPAGTDAASEGPAEARASEGAASEAPPPDRAPLGGLGKAGVGLAVAGVVGLGIGAGLAAAPVRVESGSGGRNTVSTRPPGYALLATGGALLVTGVVLLVVDRARARRRRVALVPGLGPWGGGFVLAGRF